jgi:hypothetical protein
MLLQAPARAAPAWPFQPARPVLPPAPPDLPVCLGPAAILRRVWQGDDLGPLTRALVLGAEVAAPGAVMDLACLLMTQGGALAREGLQMQANVLALSRSFVIRPGRGFTVLAFVTTGDFMANTPIDFLLADRDVTLILHYVDAEMDALEDLPPHDLAFFAVAESPENAPVLARMEQLLSAHPCPVMNGNASRIAQLTREGVSDALQGIPGLLMPQVDRLTPSALLARAIEAPVLLRPLGSHAGAGLARIETADEAAAWLQDTGARALTLTPFVDYRDADGWFAKYRIALIGGMAFASHMAVSRHWMVHYLNAEMTDHADRRAREAAWMAGFDAFAARHAATLTAIADRLDLDYLGLDCAEMPDGRLVLFEADVAMIVHDLDDEGLFPYKKPVMRRLFAGFDAALRNEARRAGPWAAASTA